MYTHRLQMTRGGGLFSPRAVTQPRRSVCCSFPNKKSDLAVTTIDNADEEKTNGVQLASLPSTVPYALLSGVSFVGVLETAYLTGAKLLGSPLICPLSGCGTALNSAYSDVFGVPLSFLGMLAYGATGIVAASATVASSKGRPTTSQDTVLAASTSMLATISAVLIYMLQAQLDGEWCFWCYMSAGLSFSLATITFAAMSQKQTPQAVKGLGLGVLAAGAAAAVFLGSGQMDKQRADYFHLSYWAPEVTSSSSDAAKNLAKRLKDAGAKMYGTFWCSHCHDQKQAFGADAMADFPYVECHPHGLWKGAQVAEACEAAGVRMFPTWVINGKTFEGEVPLQALEDELRAVTAPLVKA